MIERIKSIAAVVVTCGVLANLGAQGMGYYHDRKEKAKEQAEVAAVQCTIPDLRPVLEPLSKAELISVADAATNGQIVAEDARDQATEALALTESRLAEISAGAAKTGRQNGILRRQNDELTKVNGDLTRENEYLKGELPRQYQAGIVTGAKQATRTILDGLRALIASKKKVKAADILALVGALGDGMTATSMPGVVPADTALEGVRVGEQKVVSDWEPIEE